ncbi:hypothetical protein EAO71_17855 [Streptomyces sp. ms191]|uniref:hypothetical protein n=1 Tax=Streptomyces sp. ms191 TaxID=1827978 RepID=UPI0011CEC5EF|nr:hypothetical protein [Streptomyces sp. ms191]TXS30354.1 hypothetical protein EAO71_17855 [Streptomyces sp. ms191]
MSSDQQHPYDPYATGQQHQEPRYGYQDPDVTQTWEGQTWDTQYQPVVRPYPAQQPPAHHAGQPAPHDAGQQPAHPAAYQAQAQAQQPLHQAYPSDGTAHLAPQHVAPRPPADPYGPAANAFGTQAVPLPAETPAAPDAPLAGAGGPAYSAPTTTGNARVTDAQRARAEGRSPIIAPGMQPAALTAVLGGLLAAGAAVGSYALLVPVVLLQAVTAAGWFRLNGMWPARQGIALAFAGGLVADVVLLAAGREHAPAAILGTLGVWVLLTLVLQLRSHADPDERMYGLMATVTSAALTVVATGHLGSAPDAVVVGGLAVAAAVLARALPLPGPASVVVALLAAAGAGIAAGGAVGPDAASGALLGLGAGVCALAGLRVASYDYPSRFVHMTAGVALPLALAAPAVHLLGRVLF